MKRASACFLCSSPLNCVHTVSFRRNKMQKMMGLRKRLEVILGKREAAGLQNLRLNRSAAIWSSFMRRQQTSLETETQQKLFGRDKEKEEIRKMVLLSSNDCTEGKVTLIPIVGTGGIGKTALAKDVFNDPEVVRHFSIRAWLFVGGDCDAGELIMRLIEHTTTPDERERHLANGRNLQNIQMLLQRKFKRERFFIVLDDIVWAEDNHEWSKLWEPLAHGSRGSKVLVTTQRFDQNWVGDVHVLPYDPLKLLPDDDCLSIFKSYALTDGNSSDIELDGISAKIVEKLHGVPLAAKVMGGCLHNNVSREIWTTVVEELEYYSQQQIGILPALNLSYQHLPAPLKKCLVFCSMFPKYYKFQKEKMVRIWMANDLIQPQGDKRMEDIGSWYFEELVNRSFLENMDGDYMMHAELFDLARIISKDEFKSDHAKAHNEKVRHVSLRDDISYMINAGNFHCFKKIRTLACLSNKHDVPSPHSCLHGLFLQLECIRVLDLSNSTVTELPKSVGKLKHLRYLDVTSTKISKLPKSLSNLYGLQVLRAEEHCRLPEGMSKLVNLRHLDASARSISMIRGVGKLTCLQKLNAFSASQVNGHRLGELKDMNQLRELTLWNLQHVHGAEEASQAKMGDKPYLDSLELVWYNDDPVHMMDVTTEEGVLEALRPHTNLRSLKIRNYCGLEPPIWMSDEISMYHRLESVCLFGCIKWETLPPLGKLRYLKYLEIEGAPSVRWLGDEFYGGDEADNDVVFPLLESLVFKEMVGCNNWWLKGPSFPSLLILRIEDCPRLTYIPDVGNISSVLRKLEMVNVGLNVIPWCRTQTRSSPPCFSLNVDNCRRLIILLSSALHWVNIEHISVRNCQELIYFYEKAPSYSDIHLTSLKTLSIDGCPKLMPLPEVTLKTLTSLSSLSIRGCPNITSLPDTLRPFLPKLKKLEVSSGQKLMSLDYDDEEEEGYCISSINLNTEGCLKLHSLPEVVGHIISWKIHGCPDVRCLPDDMLPPPHALKLERLDIENCTGLTQLIFFDLASLKSLRVVDCPRIIAVGASGSMRSSLKSLQTDNLVLIKFLLSDRCVSGLEQMAIAGCSDVRLTSFAQRVQQGWEDLNSLKKLYVCDCGYLESFPEMLQSLPSLQELYITNCPRVKELPADGLPNSLRYMHISGCPDLQRYCKANWNEVSHIPKSHIE